MSRLITDCEKQERRGTGFVTTDTTLRYRLFLRSVQVGGSKSSENDHRYRFTYLNENRLPGRLSAKEDRILFYLPLANRRKVWRCGLISGRTKDIVWYVHDNVRARIVRVADNYQAGILATNIDVGYKELTMNLGGGDYYLITTTMTKNVCAESFLTYEGVPDTLTVDDPIGGVSVASIISHDPVSGIRQVKKYSYKYRGSSQFSTFRIN